MKNQVKLYICPACKSPKVRHVFAFRNAFGIVPRFTCKDCGFESRIFPLAVVDLDKLNQLNKKSKKSVKSKEQSKSKKTKSKKKR